MSDSPTTDKPPGRARIWALYGARTGDNRQVSALAQALDGTVEEKFLDYSPLYGLPNYLIGATRRTVKESARAQLSPPWPDIVIASGRRSVAPARWIKRQSGNRAKLIQIGRPRAALTLFDLVITTKQYGLPDADNVLSLSLPLQTESQTDDQKPAPSLAGLTQLPRPWTGILIGGTTWPFVVDASAAGALAGDINQWVGKYGGSAVVTTSPRTDPAIAGTLAEIIKIPYILHRWHAGADNPYDSILSAADQIIVTSDSVSMLADATRLGKPTAIWRTPVRKDPLSAFCQGLGGHADRNTGVGHLLRFAALKGLFTPPRHVGRLTEAIIESGQACWFDVNREIDRPPEVSRVDEMGLAIDRVRSLFN